MRRPRRRRAARCAAAAARLVVLSALGCLGPGVSRDEIPAAPIAFVYVDAESARQRAERIADSMGPAPVDPTDSRAVAEADAVTRYLSALLGVDRSPHDEPVDGRLALLDPRTSDVTLVAAARRGATPQDWSADRRWLLFSQVVHEGLPSLFEVDVEGGEVRRRTHGAGAQPEGCYGPEGRIVYTAVDPWAEHRNAQIMITGPGGGAEQLSGAGYNFYPGCAPDGSAVVYTSLSEGARWPRIMIRSPVLSGEPRELAAGKEASFSPDGSWIVYSARRRGHWTLWRIRPDGSGRAPLGYGGTEEQRPSLSPDNRLVVYVADTRLHQQLYLRRVDGTGDRILLADGDGDRPVW